MNIRNLDFVSSYLTLHKVALAGLMGLYSMRSPEAEPLNVTFVCMVFLYLLCWAQQFRDRKNVERVYGYLSKHTGIDKNNTERLMHLSKQVVTFAANSRHYSGMVHAAMQEVINAVGEVKNSSTPSNITGHKIDTIDVAERTFEAWRKKTQAAAENESPTTTKGN